jgi:hypothetical protein
MVLSMHAVNRKRITLRWRDDETSSGAVGVALAFVRVKLQFSERR